jgi:hypothetical protein
MKAVAGDRIRYHMAYLDQFVSALKFYFDLHLEEQARPDFTALARFLEHSRHDRSALGGARSLLKRFPDYFVLRYPGELAHACHAASAGFLMNWQASAPEDVPVTLSLTVGSVSYKGRPLFQTSRSAVADLVRAGPAPGVDLPVHAWLTLDDMTVIDLSIVSTLIKRGELAGSVDPVLFWHEDEPGEFVFEPVLVDNLFFERVDSGAYALTRVAP